MPGSCPGDPPTEEGQDDDGKNSWHKDLDDLVHQTLDVGFASLGLLG